MEHTTIAIKRETKEKIIEFGMKGETFNDIIERLVASAKERQLHDLLFNEDGFLTLKEAREKVNKKWPR